LKLLYISHLHPPKNQPLESIGGMQNVSMQLVDSFKKRDDVEINTIILHSSWQFIGIKTFFFLVTLLWKLPAAIKNYQPDVILFSSMVTASVLPFMIKKPLVPCVTINHGQDVTLPVAPYQWYLPYVFKNLKGVISVSSATKAASVQRGMNEKIGVVLPNGFDKKVELKLPEKQDARAILEEKFKINLKDKNLILTVGRLVKRKGHQWFIENVIHRIKSDVIYLVVGDGPEYDRIVNERELSPLKSNIIIAGRQSSDMLNTAYAAADLFVMPNVPVEGDMEGFGIVLLEANRAGVPAVASDLEGIKDVIDQGINGYRVPHGEAELFAQKIDDVLNNELTELSEKARNYAGENFSWDSVVNKYVSFLKTLN